MSEQCEKQVALYLTEGSTDKVYQAQLEQDSDGWRVAFQYGRRGKPLKSGVKCEGESFETASKVYDKLVASKTGKGYTPEESGVAYAGTDNAGRVTGFQPQLFNEISEADLHGLEAEDWLAQVKFDGERRGIDIVDGQPVYANRRGLEVGVHAGIDLAMRNLVEACQWVTPVRLDAEDCGDKLVIFDVREAPGIDGDTPFYHRADGLDLLARMVARAGLADILHVETAKSLSALLSADLVAQWRAAGEEGLILRHRNSLYRPGRPASGGDVLKVKFWRDVSCRVAAGRMGRRSVGIELLDGDDWIQVGNVTIPQNADIPEPGSIIDVKYLYAYAGGSIYQPTFRGVRTDVDPQECRLDRLHFVREAPRAAG